MTKYITQNNGLLIYRAYFYPKLIKYDSEYFSNLISAAFGRFVCTDRQSDDGHEFQNKGRRKQRLFHTDSGRKKDEIKCAVEGENRNEFLF